MLSADVKAEAKQKFVRTLSDCIIRSSHSTLRNECKKDVEEKRIDELSYGLLFSFSINQGYVFFFDDDFSRKKTCDFSRELGLSFGGLRCSSVGNHERMYTAISYCNLFKLLRFPEFSGLIHKMQQEELNDFFDVACLTFQILNMEFKKNSAKEGYVFNFLPLLPKQEEGLQEFFKTKYSMELQKNSEGDFFLDCKKMSEFIRKPNLAFAGYFSDTVKNKITEDVNKKLSQLLAKDSSAAHDEKLSDKSQILLFKEPSTVAPLPAGTSSKSICFLPPN